MPRRVTLIQCTASKREGTHPARDLYDESQYFRAMRAWADSKPHPWYILSAKHGLLHPDDDVADYDARGITESLAEEIAEELAWMGVEVVDITAGMGYTDPLTPELEGRGMDVIEHFAGEPIGRRLKLLKDAVAAN